MMLREKIDSLLAQVEALQAEQAVEAEELRIRFLGKKGSITQLFDEFKTVPPEQKRELGQLINDLKNRATEKINTIKEQAGEAEQKQSALDSTLPGDALPLGAQHPISITRSEIIQIFSRLGYSVLDGPEVEDDWHVFGALNFAPEHPARDMQDTFFITSGDNPVILRTHTSSVQVRAMERMKPPIRILCPGRVFRNEAISARAHCIFHQVEGLYVDENVSFADLKQSILLFAQEMFGQGAQIRLRPSYFPFTEPSAEVDVSCNICKGKGCNICKGTGWLEIMGAGMVDPNVLEACGIDSAKYTGFAFGMGVERIAMLKWQIKDLRLYFENDVRFLRQFEAV
ncbi:MAG: phenylalanine--tRNA ligase subunit alpha [Bacteroidales bacterium]|nr:phenylalanine--tRNA ligase subunit alpha [Bacteroidales bacterium]